LSLSKRFDFLVASFTILFEFIPWFFKFPVFRRLPDTNLVITSFTLQIKMSRSILNLFFAFLSWNWLIFNGLYAIIKDISHILSKFNLFSPYFQAVDIFGVITILFMHYNYLKAHHLINCFNCFLIHFPLRFFYHPNF
jgi:hypothetical protein